MTQFRVVGGGRAGLSFVSALQRCGWICADVLGPKDNISRAADEVQVVLVAVPDRSIGAVAKAIAPGDAVLVHVSGATTLDELLPMSAAGLFTLWYRFPIPPLEQTDCSTEEPLRSLATRWQQK